MKILFLSLYEIQDSDSGYIYADLIREFAKHENNIYAVTPTKGTTEVFTDGNGVKIIRVKNGQIQKTSQIKKVVNLLTLEKKTIKAVKKYAKNVKFDLIINMCSNLSFTKATAYFKKKHNAINYLLLKDIFPQNAVDIGMIKKNGVLGFVYRHFRKKEKKLYSVADYIGCMSRANVDYILAHNDYLDKSKLTVVPNSIEPQYILLTEGEKSAMRKKYGIPLDKVIFVYGGNLGKPQGIPFIIDCLRSQKDNDKVFFFIVGDGTEYGALEYFIESEKPTNVKLLKRLPREDFDKMLGACDVGMIFLDYRFTVPNYPSRLLSYMQAGLPIFACTDPNTDVGNDIVNNGIGWWCQDYSVESFINCIQLIMSEFYVRKNNSYNFLKENATVKICYSKIMFVFN